MRLRQLSGFAFVVLLAVSASAQPKKKWVKPAPKKEAAAKVDASAADADKPGDAAASDKATDKASSDKPGAVKPPEKIGGDHPAEDNPSPSASGDLGEAPPKADAAGATKLSPLTPEPAEMPAHALTPPPPAYDKLLSQIAALRSRIASITTTLYKSKLNVSVAAEGDDATVARFVITLDDGVVYTAPERFAPDEPVVVYAHAVAPGQHVLGVEVERYDSRNRQYRTWQGSKFTVTVPENKTLSAYVKFEDDSDIAEDFPDDEDGEYDLRIKLRAQVVE